MIHSQNLPNMFPIHEELSSFICCNFAERSRMPCLILFKFSIGSINLVQYSRLIMVPLPLALQEYNPRPLCSVRSLSCAKQECPWCYPGPKSYHWPISVQNSISFWLDQGPVWHRKMGLMLQEFLTTMFVHNWVLECSHLLCLW